ncbi:MAG: argS [Phycisphaerales bacterium]|nr:argS [Phycisphaerales bacterium]
MPTITSILDHKFRQAIKAAFDLDTDPLVTTAQNEKFGDYQANAAMSLAKTLEAKTGQKTNPRQIAEQIKGKLDLAEIATEISIAGPGFINVRLSPQWVAGLLQQAAASGTLGVDQTPTPQTVVVDYSGPNIAKQMHVGHLRSTIIGDAIARTLQFLGHNVIRQNHLGDWGTQFGRVVLAMWYEAVFDRTGNHAALDQFIERHRGAGQALAEATADEQDPAKLKAAKTQRDATVGAIVREIAKYHQRFIDEDPDGTKYFLPYLNEDRLNLDELERAYVFVSAITDNPEAEQVAISHPTHGRQTLAGLPRLTTTFIQNPDEPENEQERLAWEKARRITLDACSDLYRRLGVQLADPSVQEQPLERGESFYNPYLPEVVKDLLDKGVAQRSEGATVIPVPGFEAPLIIEKGSGGYLYGTTDLAAIRYRVGTLHADRIVYFVDARQGQHFTQVFWTARQAGWAKDVTLEHAAFGTILGPDNKPLKTRAGDNPKLKDLIDEAEQRAAATVLEKNPELDPAKRGDIAHAVGVGAVKYADLSKDRTSNYVFAWERMLSFDGNTAPYLQNAYVRVHGIFRKARANGIDVNTDPAAIRLESPFELAIAKHVLRLGEVIDLVARELKPHHLTNYLYELATRYHAFFENCPVLQSEPITRASRLALCRIVADTLGKGLDLLGIEHPEQM